MGLVDFMQQLQEDSSIIYSEEPEQTIRVIPPERSSVGIKVIPPEEAVTTSQPVKIKLKLKAKPKVANSVEPQVTQGTQSEREVTSQPQVVSVNQSTTQQVVERPTVSQPRVEQPKELTEDDLFIRSGTELSKKPIWLEYYQKAKTSRKQNIIVEEMKKGKFTITPDNKVLILPNYDVVHKDPDDVLKDHWF